MPRPMLKQSLNLRVVVRALSARSIHGRVEIGGHGWPCVLGRSGRIALKREGDGGTPIGSWQMREVLYRADRRFPPVTRLPWRAIRVNDGWCDAFADGNYNRRVRHPYPASAEHLWRRDGLYDVIVVLGYNDLPRIKGRGSAIFMHLAHPEKNPTAGCIALSRRDLDLLLSRVTASTQLIIPAR